MGSEKFCLQWKEFQENVRHSYKEVRRTGEFSDVTLACEDGQQIRAHKVILSASSTFFRDLLSNDHPQPLLLRGLKGADLISVVDFIYHGEVGVVKDLGPARLPPPPPLPLARKAAGSLGSSETEYVEEVLLPLGSCGEKEYRCKVCGKVSKFKGNLVRHML